MKRTKIVYFIGSLATGGAETQLLELLTHLDRGRYEAHLVLLHSTHAAKAAGLVENVVDLQAPPRPPDTRSRISIMPVCVVLTRLIRHLRRIKPDIVHAILPEALALSCVARFFTRFPTLIGSRRSLIDGYRRNKTLSFLDWVATRSATLMLGNCDAVVRELREIDGVSEKRSLRIYNGVDTKKFSPGDRRARLQYGWSDSHIVFGMVANFRHCKGHLDFIAAAARIASANPAARFVFAGSDAGRILGSLVTDIRSRGLENLFTILTDFTQPEYLYPLMDIYVCTSETEGMSNVLLEAAACGLPLIATRVGGNPEAVLSGHNGVLVDPHNPDSIAVSALELSTNSKLRQEMGLRSRAIAKSRFSIREMVDTHMALYDRMANSEQSAKEKLVALESLKISR